MNYKIEVTIFLFYIVKNYILEYNCITRTISKILTLFYNLGYTLIVRCGEISNASVAYIQELWLRLDSLSSSHFLWTSDVNGLKWICSFGIKKLANISMHINIIAIVAVIYASSFTADITSIKWLIPWIRSPHRRVRNKYFLNTMYWYFFLFCQNTFCLNTY